MADFRRTKTPGVYVRHERGCARENTDTGGRCRCAPSYRAAARGRFSQVFKDAAAALEWKTSAAHVAVDQAERAARGPSFEELAREWWAGVESGTVGKRKGRKGAGYSDTTLAGYKRTVFNVLIPQFGAWQAAELTEREWQAWVDRCSREGLSRSRIANHLAVVSAIYGWASRATRALVPRNPVVTVELPPNDEKPRERVATAEAAALLLGALHPGDAVPYALAFYAGLRRSEIARLEVADVDLVGLSITVRRSKSEAGTGRVIPLASTLVPFLWAALLFKTPDMLVCDRSVMSGKLADAARASWGWKRDSLGKWEPAVEHPLLPIGLHECRHTYASLLVAAQYTLKEVMDYMGHADLTTTSRYVKRLPRTADEGRADRLNAYLEGDSR